MTSLHLEAAPESDCVGQEDVQVARLDDLRRELEFESSATFLKLDVQGYELEVIGGAPEAMAEVKVLEAELSFKELYRGQPLFSECLELLRSTGFILVGLEPVLNHPATGELLQVNGLFHRPACVDERDA